MSILISVIIPTYNRPVALEQCLLALSKQNYPGSGFEVIVVDDGSTPPIQNSIQTMFPPLQLSLIRNTRNEGPAAARNKGVEHAQGEYIAFIDDDCLASVDWLTKMTVRLESCPAVGGGVAYGGGDIYSAASHALLESVYRYYNRPAAPPQFFASVNIAFQTKAYREVGGFDPSFRTSEDREFCARWLRSGRSLGYAPEAYVIHRFTPGLRPFFLRHYYYGKGAYLFRSLEARNRGDALKFEPPSFYRNLIRLPMPQQSPVQRMCGPLLAVLSQFASLLGFLVERRRARLSNG